MHHGLIIDNFAGGGGASTGIEQALGRPIDVAINHDDEAIAMHVANHPNTRHYCQSVWSVDPLDVVRTGGPDGRNAGQPVALAWFSPDCKHFSKAKGNTPREKHIRDLAWVVIHWIQRLKPHNLHPRVIMLENVEEFQTWGPLAEDGRPCPASKAETFNLWLRKLRRHGYKVQFRELRACDYGAPTIRKRFFMIARCDGQPIVWPEATHGPERAHPWRTAAECIDWSLPCPSIFERDRPLADTTERRIAAGIKRFVLDAPQPFIVPVCNSNWQAERAWASDEPLRTITTAKGGDMVLVSPTLITMGYGERQGEQPRVPGLNQPARTVVAGGKKYAIVEAHLKRCAAFMAQHNAGPRNLHLAGRDLGTPLSTIATRGTQQQLVTSNLIKLRNNNIAKSVDQPIDTITSQGLHFAEVRALMIKYYGNDMEGHGLDAPIGTVTTRNKIALVTVMIEGEPNAIVDIGMRMLAPHELFAAQGFPSNYILAAPRPDGKPLTKTAQVRMCGNSVCPPVPEALVGANLPNQTKEAVAA